MRQDASASGNAQQAVQGSGVQIINYGVSAASIESAISIAPPFGRRDAQHRPVRGRDALLAELAAAAGQVRVVHGLGGCGKTTVALEVAYRARQRGAEVWWIAAVEPDGLVAGLRTVGRRVGVTDAELNRGDVCDVLWERLNARSEPWLLVLDNADDPRILAGPGASLSEGSGWLRPVESLSGQVLVTSRDGAESSWGSWCVRHRLPVLPVDEAAKVLLDRAGHLAGSDDEARALADRLGGLPLALRIAGSYLAQAAAVPAAFAEPGLIRTFQQYRAALDAGDLDVVFRTPGTGQPSQDEARRLIGRTWDLSLDLLDARQIPEARRLLRLLASFADAPIPYELMLHPATLSESSLFEGLTGARLWEVLRALDGFGLIELAPGAQTGVPVARLHPLVRDTSSDAAYLSLAASLLGRAARAEEAGLPEDPPMWLAWRLLSPHILYMFESIASEHPHDSAVALAKAANLAGRYQAQQGMYRQSEAVRRRVLAVYEKALGSTHEDTLAIRRDVARMMAKREDHAGAEAEFRDVLAAGLPVQGPGHRDMLATRHEIARMMAKRGDYPGAEAEFRDVLAAELRVLGPGHGNTLTTRHEIARMMAERGDYAGAEAEFRDVLAARLSVQGQDHPHTLAAREQIARMMAERGDPEAEVEYRDVLAARLRVLGPDHPDTLVTRFSIAQIMAERGHHAGAEAELRDVLAVERRVLGPDHPRTRITETSLEELERRRKA